MEAKATARYVRVSPRKARIVIDLIRGKSVPAAREILLFSDRAIAEVVAKVLDSAVANAENQHHVRPETLVVKTAFADEGPTYKRICPRAFASARATSPSSLHRERRHKPHGSESKPHRVPPWHHRGMA